MEYILLSMCLFISIISLILNFFIGLFLVRSQQNIFNYLNNIESLLDFNPTKKQEEKTSSLFEKSWDQKYEEELDAVNRRLKEELKDIA